MQRQDREYVHGQLAVEAARIQGIFPKGNEGWSVKEDTNVTHANEETSSIIDKWRHQLAEISVAANDIENKADDIGHDMDSTVVPVSELWTPQLHRDPIMESATIPPMKIEELNNDQKRAYDIVDRHLQATITGSSPPQLLMLIPGEGGVGKTKVIQTITENFRHRGVDDWCVKGAYTGIAASLIGGKTLHVLAGIPVRGGKQSAHTLKKLRDFWRTKRYFIIDEYSMLSRTFFAKLSRIISTVMEVEEDKLFGGLNMIIVGDFHQFPPVVSRQSAPLYWPVDSRHDTEEEIVGRKIFEQFSTVVQLKKQVRIGDAAWHDVLQHVRYGNCRQQHIDMIRKLIITNPNCPPTDFTASPWKNARLVTPRHSVRNQWNSAAIRKHCMESGNRLYICPAEDMVGGRPVSNEEKIAISTHKKGSRAQIERGGLMKEIEIAIGAPVMVTLNIMTDLDVANGVRGRVKGIVVDEREPMTMTKEAHIVRLQYPPQYVLVELERSKAPTLEGLPENVIPIEPVRKAFTIEKDGRRMTVNRTQLPLTLAYAFTDYRSQGQTLDPVIVDIGPPPYGRLTPFNIYVALSRGTGRDNIRLLRDFDETLLRQHPSEYLRLEDERLERLNESTKEMWENLT